MKRILVAMALLSVSVAFSNPIMPQQHEPTAIETDFLGGFKLRKMNRRIKYRAGFNLYIAGPSGLVGGSFDYFITPKIALEIGAGARTFEPNHGFFAGGRYHFFGKTPLNLTPYVGVYSGFEYTGSDIRNYNLYIPVGIQRIKRNRIAWSIEVAYQRSSYQPESNLYGGGKIGFRF